MIPLIITLLTILCIGSDPALIPRLLLDLPCTTLTLGAVLVMTLTPALAEHQREYEREEQKDEEEQLGGFPGLLPSVGSRGVWLRCCSRLNVCCGPAITTDEF